MYENASKRFWAFQGTKIGSEKWFRSTENRKAKRDSKRGALETRLLSEKRSKRESADGVSNLPASPLTFKFFLKSQRTAFQKTVDASRSSKALPVIRRRLWPQGV